MAIFKGVITTNKNRYMIFLVSKLLLCAIGMWVPVLMKQFVDYIESEDTADKQQWYSAVQTGCLILLLKIFAHTFWENLCYYMIETGHKSHTSLKTVLFKKNFRISAATNKDYSSGEILNLIERDANRVWTFVWDLPAMIEIPFELTVASYFIYQYVGLASISGFAVFGITLALQRFQSRMNSDTRKLIDKQKDERMMQTSEVFNHAKNLKLYGWE